MTRKQMRKIAKEICEWEMIHRDPLSTKEEIAQAEDRIMQLSNQIMATKNGIYTMLEIDEMVQDLLSKN